MTDPTPASPPNRIEPALYIVAPAEEEPDAAAWDHAHWFRPVAPFDPSGNLRPADRDAAIVIIGERQPDKRLSSVVEETADLHMLGGGGGARSAGAGDDARLPRDRSGRHRPLRTDAGADVRAWVRPVLPPSAGGAGDLRRTVGRWRTREAGLPGRIDRPVGYYTRRIEIAAIVGFALVIVSGFARAALAGAL